MFCGRSFPVGTTKLPDIRFKRGSQFVMSEISGQARIATRQVTEMLGDVHPLLEQLGSMDGLLTLGTAAASVHGPAPQSVDDMRHFLDAYTAKMLFPCELPAIQAAHQHTVRNESRELLELDQKIAEQLPLPELANASRRVGRSHLRRLRPLRDQRLVRRYLAAVDEERAHGWHTLVYGLTLAIYSFPVRQGLINYAHQTMQGFVHTAAKPLGLCAEEAAGLLEQVYSLLPARIEAIINTAQTA
jgi:urease accessory protein UreF